MTLAVKLPPCLSGMGELEPCNGAVRGRVDFLRRLETDGYLYFQGVLDRGAVERLKRVFIDRLIDLGVVDAGSTEPIWNGADLSDYPKKIEALHERKAWEPFVAEPAINGFFRSLLETEPFWIPVVEYRLVPPSDTPWEDPFVQRHQDRMYNQGMSFATCWFPLMEIDERVGGLAIAAEMNHVGNLHDVNDPPQFPIPDGAIPDGAWRRAHYREGDLVMFGPDIPHTGLPNHSDRFRLSMDVRVATTDTDLPVVGEVVDASLDQIKVRKPYGETLTLALDEETYCRWHTGVRLPLEEMVARLRPGQPVLASVANGRVILLRPPR